MPKILVADDNSNIQKMVGLALKDQGIDVVAVGNGEAAVRKISDVRPDLVLADVFMPVRNGYEVCAYVKADSALAHIPVILLVGAFDPLDEQEAQRVGADGVLKKPFVPPEPLISMVKSALARAGSSAPVATAGRNNQAHAPEATVHSPAAEIPEVMAFTPATPEAPVAEAEEFVEDIPARPAEFKIESGSLPAAFGSLLETPETEQEQPEEFVSTAQPSAVLERDWHSGADAEDSETEEEEPSSSWRRDGGDEAFVTTETSGADQDWRDTSLAEAEAPAKSGYSGFVDAEETQEFVSSVPETVSAEPVTSYSAEPAEEHSSGLIPSEPVPANSATTSGSPTAAAPPSNAQKPGAPTAWPSAATNPWEAEAQKANQLASSWDAPKALVVEASAATSSHKTPTPQSNAPVLSASAVDAIREEAAQVAESVADGPSSNSGTAKPASPDIDMEAMVAKVMAKMNPDVLQALTRELLKPMIETIVKNELDTKKS